MPSEHMTYKIGRLTPVRDRIAFIVEMCRNQRVMHLGCAAWPLTDQQLKDGTLLHSALCKVAKRVYGVDLSEEGIEFLRERGFKDLIRWDVEKLSEIAIEEPVDVIVAGEVLEHVSNPGRFLTGASNFMKNRRTTLIISVPNAFSLRHFVPVLLHRTELVMPDHTAYYSFSTLKELLQRCDLEIVEGYTFNSTGLDLSAIKRRLKRSFNTILMHTFPQVSEGLMVLVQVVGERTTGS